ncbi:hypothetical protein FB107DRAFT_216807 [Schizophyllum commune]
MRQAAAAERAYDNSVLDDLLENLGESLRDEGKTLADLLERAFNPSVSHKHDWRWRHFFQHRDVVWRIFGHWTGPGTSTSARATVRDWVLSQMEEIARQESQAIIDSGELRKSGRNLDEQYFLNYQPHELAARLRGMASGVFRVLAAFSRTTKQAQQRLSETWRRRKEIVAGELALATDLACYPGRSGLSPSVQSIIGTYFMATGAQRQHFSVLSRMGITMGYTSIIASGDRAATGRSPGTLVQLSNACRATAQRLAATRLFGVVYDNINMSVRIAEQIVGRKNAQENGTCATVFPLHNVALDDLDASKLESGIRNAPPLTEKSLRLTDEEQTLYRNCMVHTILRIIVNHGGVGFLKHKDTLKACLPRSVDAIDVHKTSLHPLPAMEIDENKLTGNVEIMESILKELQLDINANGYTGHISIVAGDQLTLARQRAIQHVRVGHEVGFQAWRHIVLMPGLFHAKIADCHGVLETHFGRPQSGPRSPGSLSFHNQCLGRLPIVLTSLPPFRTTRDLIFVSLYARILHCLLLVTKTANLDEAARTLGSWDTLYAAAERILDTFADADRVQELREEREPEERERDMVFENAVLYVRDALLTREFSDAIKAGDSGRVLVILKLWVFSYRGSGRTKYAHEMLHLLHNILHVWPTGIRRAILQNWLQNPTGKPNAFVEIDLIQEHLNYWIKRIYKADGDGHSWTWLAMITPTISILRSLANHVNSELGARQGKRHTAPTMDRDIARLMDSLEKYEVYTVKPGRVLDFEEKPVPDVIAVGMAALTCGSSKASSPLQDFNAAFEFTRQRHALTPLATLAAQVHGVASSAQVSTDNGDGETPRLKPPSDGPSSFAPVDMEEISEWEEEDVEDEDEDVAMGHGSSDTEEGDGREATLLSPTLPLADEDDVALDMDELDLSSDEEEEESDVETFSDGDCEPESPDAESAADIE